MGIYGLKLYNKEVLCTSKRGSIVRLAEDYRRKNNCQPVLLIDGSNFLYTACFALSSSSLIKGGEFTAVTKGVVKFLLRLRENNINYVMFFDESTRLDRVNIRKKRNYQRQKDVKKLIDCLDDELPYDDSFCSMEGLVFYLKNYLTAVGAKYITGVNEADDEIMAYASQHGCFGVLTEDTDFLVVQGIPYIFGKFNIVNLTAEYTNCHMIASAMGLRPNLLPYFATLCGNDVITRGDLQEFHLSLLSNHRSYNKISQREFLPAKVLFPAVIDWLKRVFQNDPADDEAVELAKFLQLPHLASDFRKSVDSYTLKPNLLSFKNDLVHRTPSAVWNKLLDMAIERVVLNTMHMKVYDVMAFLFYSCGCCLQIYDSPHYFSSAFITVGMSSRLYGFLLSELPAELGPPVVREWVFNGANSIDSPKIVHPEFPGPKKLFDLATYWKPSCLSVVKWEIFCWIIDPVLIPKDVMSLPRPLCAPTLALHLINSVPRKAEDDWAVESLLVQAALMLVTSLSDLENVKYERETSVGVHFSSVYKVLCREIYIAAQACGSPLAIYHYPEVPFFEVEMFNAVSLKIKAGSSGLNIIHDRNIPYVTEAYQKMTEFLARYSRNQLPLQSR